MRNGFRAALAALSISAALVGAEPAHAETPLPAAPVVANSDWVEVGVYNTSYECDNAGLKGQNHRWWVAYYCDVQSEGAAVFLNVKYHW